MLPPSLQSATQTVDSVGFRSLACPVWFYLLRIQNHTIASLPGICREVNHSVSLHEALLLDYQMSEAITMRDTHCSIPRITTKIQEEKNNKCPKIKALQISYVS